MGYLIAMFVLAIVYDVAYENMATFGESARITATLLLVAFFIMGVRKIDGKRKAQ